MRASSPTRAAAFAALVAVAALTLGAGIATAQKKKPKNGATPGLSAAGKQKISRAVSRLLLRPRGAAYRWHAFVTRKGTAKGARPYCGEVNALNAIGKPAGYRPYLAWITLARGRVAEVQVHGIANRDLTNPVTAAVLNRCRAAGYKVSLER